jgi:glycosyltransferase involved in cell wall biosynthesis
MKPSVQISPRDLYLGCLSDVRGWGGALASANAAAAASRRRGVSTLLLGATARRADLGAAPPDAPRLNVHLAREPLLWRIHSWRAAKQLALRLRHLPPPRAAFLALSPYWAIAARQVWPHVPVFYRLPCVLHNCLPFTWPHQRPPTVWARLNSAGITHAEHLAFALADLTFAPTELARQEVLHFHPAARGRVQICPEAYEPRHISTELRRAQRHQLDLNENAVVFLAAGHCDPNKAFAWAISELPQVDPRGRLIIVGSGPEQPRLAQLASELGLTDRVHVVGPHADMEPWYAAADCVLSTSRYDTFPNSLSEAMCRGRPVLVPQHAPPQVYAGFTEVVAHEGGGLLYDRTKPGALAACMDHLVRDPAARDALGRQAHLAAEQWYRRGSIVDRIFTWLRQAPSRPLRKGTGSAQSPANPMQPRVRDVSPTRGACPLFQWTPSAGDGSRRSPP